MTASLSLVTPAQAAGAYGRVARGDTGTNDADSGFGAVLQRAAQSVIDTGHAADAQSAQAVSGGGNLTDVVAAVSRADLALQATTAIRDRMVQAYQEIMRMPI